MRVAMIGTGLQARRRAPVLDQSKHDSLTVVVSSSLDRARSFAQPFGCESSDNWRAVVARDDVDAVVICTTPESHADICIAALTAGKHVLCEKPLSRTLEEAQRMVAAAEASKRVLKCGFNHRHHPAVLEAKRIVDRGQLGRLIIGRCRYGMCGRPGYESEWRGSADKAAGGHLVELGIHGIDLFRWFFGDIGQVAAMTGTLYFPMKPLDDNGMALFRHSNGALCSLHSSLTQWKNLFSFEVIGTEGYLSIDGLGASYGTEHLTVGRRDFDAPFQDVITHYRGNDKSWQFEWEEFASAVAEDRTPLGDGRDGLEAMRAAFAAYEADKASRTISISEARSSRS